MYDVHPSVSYARAILDNLPVNTGRSADEWKALLLRNGPSDSAGRRAWLKAAHGLGATTAALIVGHAEGGEDADPAAYLAAAPGYVDAMYEGPKQGLRPLHDRLLELGRGLGPDIRVCPCKTIVPLYRNHVFAQIRPATHSRIDLGLALRGGPGPVPDRIIPTGGLEKGDRVTHRIPITGTGDIDTFVARWLRNAYDLDAG